MVRISSLFSISALVLLVAAQDSPDAARNQLEVSLAKSPANPLQKRSLEKRCSGSCATCFGAGYTLCPGSSIYCYKPGDARYGLESCASTVGGSSGSSAAGGSSPTTASSAPASTATDSICTQKGATCVSCFGAGYLDCPDNYHCYNPNDSAHNTCPSSTSTPTAGGSTSGGDDGSCAQQYGSGSVPCGSDSCYNPNEGDVCCADGYHCENGNTCSTIVGKCCLPGSTKSGCSGAGGSSLTSSFSYSSYTSATRSSFTYSNTATAAGVGGTRTTSTDTAGSTTTSQASSQSSGSAASSDYSGNTFGTLFVGGIVAVWSLLTIAL